MKRLIFILFLCISSVSYGQKKLEIGTSNLPKDVKPGQYFSLFFNISNPELLPNNCQSRLLLPTNWKVLTEKKLQTTDSSFVIKYIYTISTFSQAEAGSYPIDFQFFTEDSVITSRRFFVNLEEVRQIEIIPLNQPEFVKEGDILRIEYLVQNFGNKTERLKLETTHGVIENIKDSIEISPNSYFKAIVKQSIPKTDYSSWQTSSDLKASFLNQTMPIFQAVSIPVYSTKIKRNDPFLRFPVQMGGGFMSYQVGKQTISAVQYFAEGKGYLDFSNKHHLDFTIRGPNQFAFPSIGNYDEYGVSYTYLGKTNITAGDYVLRFNNLMEFGRFGRGLKVEHTIGQTSVMAFYQQARFSPNQKDAFGGRYLIKLKGESNVSFNFISKAVTYNNSSFQSNLIGTSYTFRKQWLRNETELVLGHAKNQFDVGFYNKLYVEYKKLTGNSEIIHAGKDFYGFYTNSLLLVNNVSYYLTNKLNVGISSNITKVNPSLDVLKYSISPYSTTNMAFVSYQPNAKNMLFLNFTKQEREDRQKPSKFHFREDFGNFSYSLNTQTFTLFSQGRYGFAQNLLVEDSLSKRQSISQLLQPSVAILPWLWIGGYLEYQHTTKYSSNSSYQNLYYYGGNVRVKYKKNVSLNFMYRNNYAPDEFFEKRSFMDGSLLLDYDRHQFSLNTGKAYLPNLPNNEQNSFSLYAKYVVKLNVPIRKDKKLGHIKGQIIGFSEDIKREGILMQVGQYKILTDSNGIFNFPNLMPNTYYMTMINSNNPVGVVSTLKTPIEINIKADSTTFLTIPLIKTGGVMGRIEFEKNETPPSVKPTIYIKLFNANESFVTELNDKNEFSFKEMKPGSWKLKAIIVGKNEQFEILNSEQEVDIEAGKIKKSQFTVKVTERKIQFSGKNFHISSQK